MGEEISRDFVVAVLFVGGVQIGGFLLIVFALRDRWTKAVESIADRRAKAVLESHEEDDDPHPERLSMIRGLLHRHNEDSEAHGHLVTKLRAEFRYEVQDKLDKHQTDQYAHPTAFERLRQEIVKSDERWEKRIEMIRDELLAAIRGRN